jgi:hypothetical protein
VRGTKTSKSMSMSENKGRADIRLLQPEQEEKLGRVVPKPVFETIRLLRVEPAN